MWINIVSCLFCYSCQFLNNKILTYNTLESEMLKRPQPTRVFTLNEFIIPSHKKTIDSIAEMTEIRKQILSQLAAAMAIISELKIS